MSTTKSCTTPQSLCVRAGEVTHHGRVQCGLGIIDSSYFPEYYTTQNARTATFTGGVSASITLPLREHVKPRDYMALSLHPEIDTSSPIYYNWREGGEHERRWASGCVVHGVWRVVGDSWAMTHGAW
jgi:hypothetical protein